MENPLENKPATSNSEMSVGNAAWYQRKSIISVAVLFIIAILLSAWYLSHSRKEIDSDNYLAPGNGNTTFQKSRNLEAGNATVTSTPATAPTVINGKTFTSKDFGFSLTAAKGNSWEVEHNMRAYALKVQEQVDGNKFVVVKVRDWKNVNGGYNVLQDGLAKYEFDFGVDSGTLPRLKTVQLGGRQAGYYVSDNSKCQGDACPNSFVAIVTVNNELAYELYFYGDAVVDTIEQKTLDSFKFLKQ